MRGRACWPEAGLLIINVQDTTTAQSACSRPCTALPLPLPFYTASMSFPTKKVQPDYPDNSQVCMHSQLHSPGPLLPENPMTGL